MIRFDREKNSESIPSVAGRVRRPAVDMPVIAVHFIGEHAAFVGVEENVALVNEADASFRKSRSTVVASCARFLMAHGS